MGISEEDMSFPEMIPHKLPIHSLLGRWWFFMEAFFGGVYISYTSELVLDYLL